MDTSETYIKMCRKAEEIQALTPEDDYGGVKEFRAFTNDDYIWLPRQDQLQEMVSGYWLDGLGDIFRAVRDFTLTKYHPIEAEFPFTSMEQLWLAFVMKEKYNKIWNGKEWERL